MRRGRSTYTNWPRIPSAVTCSPAGSSGHQWYPKPACVVIVLRFAAEPLFSLVLGAAWLSAVPLFRIFVINMAISALNSVLASYLRAVGDARAVTVASLLQVVALVVSVPPSLHMFGVTGVAWSMTFGLSSCAAWMLYRVSRQK